MKKIIHYCFLPLRNGFHLIVRLVPNDVVDKLKIYRGPVNAKKLFKNLANEVTDEKTYRCFWIMSAFSFLKPGKNGPL